jgi:hypothetical protein
MSDGINARTVLAAAGSWLRKPQPKMETGVCIWNALMDIINKEPRNISRRTYGAVTTRAGEVKWRLIEQFKVNPETDDPLLSKLEQEHPGAFEEQEEEYSQLDEEEQWEEHAYRMMLEEL